MPGMPCLPASGAEDWKSHSASTKNISCIAFLRMPRVCHDYKVCFFHCKLFFFSKTKTPIKLASLNSSLMCESSLGVFPRHLKEMLAKGHSWPWQDSRDTDPPPLRVLLDAARLFRLDVSGMLGANQADSSPSTSPAQSQGAFVVSESCIAFHMSSAAQHMFSAILQTFNSCYLVDLEDMLFFFVKCSFCIVALQNECCSARMDEFAFSSSAKRASSAGMVHFLV